ncbi:MAG: hypothetical protein OHK0013_21740 [Sandaracinaceae bacterium]
MLPAVASLVAALVVHASLLAHASPACAQEGGGDGERTPSRAPAAVRWEPGPAPELWAAPAVGLSLGGLTLALAIVLGQVATANHREATDPMTTQARAYELARTVPDLSLAANVLFAVGGGMALIGATWLVALPFSQHPVAAVQASLGPSGLTISGSF